MPKKANKEKQPSKAKSNSGTRFMEQSQMEHQRPLQVDIPFHFKRDDFAKETLMRYSGLDITSFQPFILLTNFPTYVHAFAQREQVEMISGPVLNVANCPEKGMTIIDYQLGSPMAALIVDLLSYTHPQCVVMLGLCGGLHRRQNIGDFLLPVAAIRDEGSSRHYMPPQVPSLPAFMVQQFISQELMSKNIHFMTGVIHSTDYRMWEYDQHFITVLEQEKATAIDMECSALFTVGFNRKVPVGALMLVSDMPLMPGGRKTRELSSRVFKRYRDLHLECGVNALMTMRRASEAGEVNFRRFLF